MADDVEVSPVRGGESRERAVRLVGIIVLIAVLAFLVYSTIVNAFQIWALQQDAKRVPANQLSITTTLRERIAGLEKRVETLERIEKNPAAPSGAPAE